MDTPPLVNGVPHSSCTVPKRPEIRVTTLGIAVPNVDVWYFDTLRAGAESVAGAAGVEVQVLVEPLGRTGRAVVTERWAAALADPDFLGAVSIHYDFESGQRDRLLAHGKPVVTIGGRCPGLPSVFIDDVAVARLATEHLLALGHRRIAHLAGFARSPDDFSMRIDRIRGYSEAMRNAGLENQSQVLPCDFDPGKAYQAAHGLLRGTDRPTAIFAAADVLAAAVLAAARDLAIAVPGDLSVIGIDDAPESAALGLTTLRQDPYAQGAAAARRVLGQSASDEQRFDVELVHRTSTAAPGGGSAPGRPGRFAALFRSARQR
jgi:DNA-binding LacI/PurR family transcriptional regulator